MLSRRNSIEIAKRGNPLSADKNYNFLQIHIYYMTSKRVVLAMVNPRKVNLGRVYEDYFWPLWMSVVLLVLYTLAIGIDVIAGPATHTDYSPLHQVAALLFTSAVLMTIFSLIGWGIFAIIKRS